MATTKKNDYWRQREESWISKNIQDDKKVAEQVTAHYQTALKNIQDDISRYYVSYAGRDGISMDEAIKKVASFDVKAFEATAKKMVEAKDFSEHANERLRAYNATMRINRLEMLKSEVSAELAQATSNVERDLGGAFKQAYTDETKRQAGILGKHVIDAPKAKVESIVNASFHGASWSQRLWVNHDELKGALDGILSRAMVQGINPKTIVSSLMPLINTTVTNKRYVAERLAITETARIQDTAQMNSFKQFGFDYCVWVAEPSACERCIDIANANDGIYPITEVPGIPEHPACRCSKAAYVPTKEELAKWGVGEAGNAEAASIDPESILDGVKRGDPMSIDQADKQNANPNRTGTTERRRANYAKSRKELDDATSTLHQTQTQLRSLQAAYKKNPGDLIAREKYANYYQQKYQPSWDAYDKARKKLMRADNTNKPYAINCQRCAPAYELRRRGFDVTALPNLKKGDWQEIYGNPRELWLGPDGKPVIGTKLNASDNASVTKALLDEMESGQRGTLTWSWANSKSGHIINVERTDDGLEIIDSQSGIRTKNFEDYMASNRFKTVRGVEYNRVDDKVFDLTHLDEIVKGAVDSERIN